MLADLLRRLAGSPEEAHLSPHDEHVALAALMVRVARTDGHYNAVEQTQIDRSLAAHFRIGAAEASELRAEAEVTEQGAPDTVSFTRVVKQAVPFEDRDGVVEALWEIAAADGIGADGIGADERGFLRLVTKLLGVTDRDSGLARQRAVRGAGD